MSLDFRREDAYSINQMMRWKELVKNNIIGYALHCNIPLEKSNCTFGNFSIDERNRAIVNAAISWYKEKSQENITFYSSDVGCGKTHLAVASVINYALLWDCSSEYKPKIRFYTFSKLVKEFKEFYSNDDFKDLDDDWGLKYLADLDILILDDVGSEKTTEFVSGLLYDIMEARSISLKPTVVTTNVDMREMEKRYGKRVASRVHGGVNVTFNGDDNRIRKIHKREIPKSDIPKKHSLVELVRTFRYRQTSDILEGVYKKSLERVRDANRKF